MRQDNNIDTYNIDASHEKHTASEYAHSTLRAAILNGTLSGGMKLLQGKVARELGVSTTPVREALRGLASEGLVTFGSNRGVTVRSLTLPEVEEIYELRIILEPLMVQRTVGKISNDDLKRATSYVDQLDEEENISTWVDINRNFHAIFGEAPESSRLAKILTNLRNSASAYVALSLRAQPQRRRDSNKEHRLLIDLYAKEDTQAIVDLVTQHLCATMATIRDAHKEGLI